MHGLVDRFVEDERGLSEVQKALFVAALAVSVVAITVFLPPSDQQGPVNPQAQWEWNTSDGDVVVTHDGGDGIPREELTIVITDDGDAETITNLNTGSDHRIVRPFPNEFVTAGDSLVLDGGKIDSDRIAIRWESEGRSAMLSETRYPPAEHE